MIIPDERTQKTLSNKFFIIFQKYLIFCEKKSFYIKKIASLFFSASFSSITFKVFIIYKFWLFQMKARQKTYLSNHMFVFRNSFYNPKNQFYIKKCTLSNIIPFCASQQNVVFIYIQHFSEYKLTLNITYI